MRSENRLNTQQCAAASWLWHGRIEKNSSLRCTHRRVETMTSGCELILTERLDLQILNSEINEAGFIGNRRKENVLETAF